MTNRQIVLDRLPGGDWADRRKVPAFNLFYADLEADAKERLAAWQAR